MLNTAFNEDGWIDEEVLNKLEQTGKLEGDDAIAFISCQFSNATKNNYDPIPMLNRTGLAAYKITIEKR